MSEEWMTYADAAARLGIKPDSVKRQARSKKWAKRTMNDGTVQVAVPADRLPDARPAVLPSPPPEDSGADRWAEERAELSARASIAEARAEAAERRATEIAEDRDRWQDMARTLAERPGFWARLLNRR